jgi:hypothetical protein
MAQLKKKVPLRSGGWQEHRNIGEAGEARSTDERKPLATFNSFKIDAAQEHHKVVTANLNVRACGGRKLECAFF